MSIATAAGAPEAGTSIAARLASEATIENITYTLPVAPVPVPVPVPPIALVPDIPAPPVVAAVPAPTVTTPKDLGYPTSDDSFITGVHNIFASHNVGYTEMSALLRPALATGNLDSFVTDMEAILSPRDATLAKSLLEGVRDAQHTKQNAAMQVLHEAAGGTARYNAAAEWADRAGGDAATVLGEINNSTNPAIQKLLTGQLMEFYTKSGNDVPTTAPAIATSTNTGGVPTGDMQALEPITAREYAEGLKALMDTGRWNGQDLGAPNAVVVLRARAKQSGLAE
jgi:hypothetical protein